MKLVSKSARRGQSGFGPIISVCLIRLTFWYWLIVRKYLKSIYKPLPEPGGSSAVGDESSHRQIMHP